VTLGLLVPRWHRYARCKGRLDLFFARDELSRRIAVKVCEGCGVRRECLAAAMSEEADAERRYGIRGGLLPAERAALAASGGGTMSA
jgi:hypothetical protein